MGRMRRPFLSLLLLFSSLLPISSSDLLAAEYAKSSLDNTNDTANLSQMLPTSPPKMTSRPTASPTPNPYLTTIQTATPQELSNDGSTSTSYGYIFNMRTTPESPAIQITSFDFLTSSTSSLEFELYSTPSSYANFKGNYGRWVLMGKGSVVGKGMGSYTSIPEELIDPVPIDGLGGIRAFYLTLNTRDMIYRSIGNTDGDESSSVEEVVQQSSDSVTIYQGEAVQSFPFPPSASSAYVGPAQFVGAVRYDALPCRPLEAYGTVYKMPCPILPTASPAPSSGAPTTAEPTGSRRPSAGPTLELTPEPSYMPTTSSPTASLPPSASPTSAPAIATEESKVNVLLTVRNTPNRIMTASEEEEFTEKLLGFFSHQSLLEEDVAVKDIQVWHQQQVDWIENAAKLRRGRDMQQFTPQQLVSTAITLKFTILHRVGEYAVEEIGGALVNVMEEKDGELVLLLRGSEFDFFVQADAIQSMAMDKLTAAPVAAPKSVIQKDVVSELETVEDSTDESNVGVYAGVGAGVFAFCSVIIGLSYFIFKKRKQDYETKEAHSQSANSDDIETGSQSKSSKRSNAVAKFVSPAAIESDGKGEDGGSSSSDSSSSNCNNVSERSRRNNNASEKGVTNEHNPVEFSDSVATSSSNTEGSDDIKKKKKPRADHDNIIANIIANNQTKDSDTFSSSSSASSSGSDVSDSEWKPKQNKDKVKRKASQKSTKQKKMHKEHTLLHSDSPLKSSTRDLQRMQSESKQFSKSLGSEYNTSFDNNFSEPLKRHRSRSLVSSGSRDRVDLNEGADRRSRRHLTRSESLRSMSKDRDVDRSARRHLNRSESLRPRSKERGADMSKRRSSKHLIAKDKKQITDELKKLKTSDGLGSSRHSSKHSSSNQLRKTQRNSADELDKLKSSGGSDSLRPSSRHSSSNDLRKKRQKRKSKRNTDLKESSTSGGSDGKIKRRGTDEELKNSRTSESSTDNVRRSFRDLNASGHSKRKMSDSKKPMRRRTTIS